MNFSLVTTCWNEKMSLPRWRRDIENQTRPPDEIVIVDNLSDDGTREELLNWAESDPRVRVIEKQCNAAQGRNIAIASANFDHVVSTDMGVSVHAVWFSEITKPFEADVAVEIVVGAYAIDLNSILTPVARAEYYAEGDRYPFVFDDHGQLCPRDGFVPGNLSLAYKKKVWKELGGLPEDLTLCADDAVFGRQILAGNYKIAYAPKAMVYWHRFNHLHQYWNEQYRYGIGEGECGLPERTPYVIHLYRKGIVAKKLVPWLHGVRILQKQMRLAAIIKAIKKGDIQALAVMPILFFGNGYHNARGYLLGDEQGLLKCKQCRERVQRLSIKQRNS